MNEPGREGLSRRSLLKRAGVGAALVWSAPIITSLNTPAYAGSPPPPECQTCEACQFGTSCGGDGACFCVGVPDCFCTRTGVCINPDPICQTDADCDSITGPGSRCSPCALPGCTETMCWVPCGTTFKAKLPAGARVIQLSA